MDVKEFDAHRRTVETDAGTTGYADFGGGGPAALFVHGIFLNGLLWRNAIEDLQQERRCIAIDIPGHGGTRVKPDHEWTLAGHAQFLASFLDAVGLDQVDLVGNDSGGAIAQMFAVRHPDRVRSLTLTNCDTPGNFPPEAFRPTIELARAGGFPTVAEQLLRDDAAARDSMALGYEHPEQLPDEVIRGYLGPAFENADAVEQIVKFMTTPQDDEMDDIEPELKGLDIPALLVWGTDDVFFPLQWAHRLRDTLPNVRDLVEIQGGKLFFVDERASELVPHVRTLWKES